MVLTLGCLGLAEPTPSAVVGSVVEGNDDLPLDLAAGKRAEAVGGLLEGQDGGDVDLEVLGRGLLGEGPTTSRTGAVNDEGAGEVGCRHGLLVRCRRGCCDRPAFADGGGWHFGGARRVWPRAYVSSPAGTPPLDEVRFEQSMSCIGIRCRQ
jgi:hypothetical protein